MNDATRTCLKCGAPVRFLLCDRHYAETPHCDEPIAVSPSKWERVAADDRTEVLQ